MNKPNIFLLIAVSLFVSFALIPNTKPSKNQFISNAVTEPTSYNVLTLSHKEAFIHCKLGYVPTESCPDQTIINVTTSVTDPEGEEVEIKYAVSGGQIIGKGTDVQWDLSDVKEAGVYTVTVEFIDYNKEKVSKTETISVRNCECPNDCVCPKVSVSASSDSVKAGKIVTFTAKIKDKLPEKVVYNWTVSQGKIIEGQGTTEIKVKTNRELIGMNLTASFELSGDEICLSCETSSYSETVSIIE